MPIPPFNPTGLLPAGIHPCTLAEIQSVFCKSTRRTFLYGEMTRFLTVELPLLRAVGAVYVDGSFVRTKPDPDDVDLVIDISNGSDPEFFESFYKISTSHEAWKQSYSLDVWPYHPMLPKNLVSFFQYAGEKAAAELNINRKDPKGILRLT